MAPSNPVPENFLETARQWEAAGEHERADALLRAALVQNPNQPEALHLLGTIALAAGRLAEAIALFSRAIKLVPADGIYHLDLGVALIRAGENERALACLRKAVEVQPMLIRGHLTLGVALRMQGRYEEAVAPLGRAVELMPQNPDAWAHLGAVLRELSLPQDALPCLEHAVKMAPRHLEARVHLALVLSAQQRDAEALEHCDAALELDAHSVDALLARAGSLGRLGRLDEAVADIRRALELDPNYAYSHLLLGNTLFERAQFEEAAGCFDRALQIDPQIAEAHLGKSMTLLLRGDLVPGFVEQEWIWRVEEYAGPHARLTAPPRVTAADLRGKTLRLLARSGRGDAIHLLRYAALLQAQGTRVQVVAHPELVKLFATAPGVESVHAFNQPAPPADVLLPFESLPRVFATTLETIPARVPYLAVPAGTEFKLPGAPGGKFRVGLAWAGDATNRRDYLRSTTFETLEPLLDVACAEFFSLQVGRCPERFAECVQAGRLTDLAPQLKDYADTAAAITALDLVITIDTSTAHLAGALGKPVWTLLAHVPDWRWLLEREDSPWYPTMRLFRQPAPGDWAAVIQRVRAELERLIATRRIKDK